MAAVTRRRRHPVIALALSLGLTVAGGAASLATDGTGVPSTDELEAMGPQILERVEAMRGLDATAPVPIRAVAPETAVSEHRGAMTADDRAELVGEGTVLRRIGFLPADFDLLAAVDDLAMSGVAGYYRPEQGDIALVESTGLPLELAAWTVAHEYVHALQDQHYDIESTVDAAPQGDAQTAVSALAEGDATLLMTAVAMSDALSGVLPSDTAIASDQPTGMEDFPQTLSRELIFPYLDGLDFAQRMWGRGGWTSVDAVWQDPPRSTEQVMHPERYPDDVPVAVELPDVAGLLGEGWTTAHETTMGELRLSLLVAGNEPWEVNEASLTGITLPNAGAAEGWGGDRLVTLDGPEGSWTLVWQTVWDTPEDAAEFAAAATEAMPGWVAASAVLPGTTIAPDLPADRSVLLLTADDAATLAALESALGVG